MLLNYKIFEHLNVFDDPVLLRLPLEKGKPATAYFNEEKKSGYSSLLDYRL